MRSGVLEDQHDYALEAKLPGNCNNNFQFRGVHLIKFRVMEDMRTEGIRAGCMGPGIYI